MQPRNRSFVIFRKRTSQRIFICFLGVKANSVTEKPRPGKHLRAALFLLPALFSPTSSLRAAFHRLRGVDLAPDVEVGYEVLFDNLFPERVHVGSGATISARSTILSHDEAKAYAWGGREIVADTYIGDGAFLGVAAVILPGVRIGARSIIGAGAIVTHDVPQETIAVGIPARVIRRRSTGE